MYNKVQLSIIKAWCKWHGKNLEAGALEWISLYAAAFRQIMNKG